MKRTAKIYGVELPIERLETSYVTHTLSGYELVTAIEVASTRSESQALEIEFDTPDLVNIQFTDNTEWIGHPEDIQELYGIKGKVKRDAIDEDYLFEPHIFDTGSSNRNGVKRALVKLLTIFKPKKPTAFLMKELAAAFDGKVQPRPQLYQMTKDFRKKEVADMAQGKNLLLIHGTLSNVEGSFGGLLPNGAYERLFERYDGNVIALEHYTLSESPLENALYFLNALPDDVLIDMDIISHSRGGLVADILAKCDQNNAGDTIGFSSDELRIVKKHDIVSHDLMLQINEAVLHKKITVGKVVRVACPASGTTILSKRIDHFFNLLLNSISLAFGITSPLYSIVKSFVLELVAQKEDPSVLAGLNSMMPESYFQKMLNSADTEVASTLYTISGDAEVDGLNFNSLKVILANLFYRTANDLVVDTERMVHGVKRKEAIHTFLSQDGNTSHFNYFSNTNSCDAILTALNCLPIEKEAPFKPIVQGKGKRGVLLDFFSLDGTTLYPDTITRDVVIVLPGIMGSTLAVNDKDLWVAMSRLNDGVIEDYLNNENPAVYASGVVKKFYGKLGKHLSADYDVITFAFDWRKSLADTVKQFQNELNHLLLLENINVHIVAHSMGGLLVRQCMMDFPTVWNNFRANQHNKLLLLGTPWRGSYLIMEVLTGHSRRVKQLAMIDFDHDREELLEVFWNYPGLFELLPLEDDGGRKFWTQGFWQGLGKTAKLKHMPNPKDYGTSLKNFDAYRKKVLTFLDNIESDKSFFENIYYICGKDEETVFDYTFKDRFLSRHKKLVYQATWEGDGSVTWDSGIPKPLLNSQKLYYSDTTHGELANKDYIFKGISDILKSGGTTALSKDRPRRGLRGGMGITEVEHFPVPLTQIAEVEDALFDIRRTKRPEREHIHVKVVNADLEMSTYPVMVGHFFMDLILSAEKALDRYLNKRLSQRMDIGYYPGKVGESEIFFNLNTRPKGAIVCGLGTPDKLTSYLLAKTVRLATLRYAMFMRDNYTLPRAKKSATGISCILIGIGFGKLPVEDSLKGILLGISEANEQMKKMGKGLQPIKEVEILNYYESIASQAYYSLNRLEDKDHRLNFTLHKGIVKRPGAKKMRLFSKEEYEWWYNLHITSLIDDSDINSRNKVTGFKYYASRGLARIEEEMINIGMHKVQHLLKTHAKDCYWSPSLSKNLFQLIIPNEFKNVFRNQGNLVLKVDKNAAEIPWELLHDPKTGETPIAVTASFIRQLVTTNSDYFRPVALGNTNVLVVGDPIYNDDTLQPLPAAKAEAEWVVKRYDHKAYVVTPLINSTSNEIIDQLYNQEFKIMHFAGHGVYDIEKDTVGIAIGDGIFIDPAMIKQMGYVPEFVFINCCHSGAVDASDEAYYQNRYKLAANIGTELIDMGIKAIIVTGWAVDDAAAQTFAETFYTHMMQGYDFGNSVQRARLATHQNHRETNTWGAYQCYGNPFYKFDSRQGAKEDDYEYVMASQVHTDIDNLLSAIRDRRSASQTILEQLEQYIQKASYANLLDALVLEKEALVYDELGYSDIALQKFHQLFVHDNGNFSVEALERYCTIKVYQMRKENVKETLQEIDMLALVGKNPNRLNIIGNAYKFASIFVTAKTQKMAYLEKALEKYTSSLMASEDRFDGGYLDAITNIIFIGHILELRGQGTLLQRLESIGILSNGKDPISYLSEFYHELEAYDMSDTDISVQIGMTETKYGLMLLKDGFDPSENIDLKKRYKNIFDLMYSPRYIKIEIHQINFLLEYITNKTIVQQLEAIKKEVKKLKDEN